MKLSLNFYRLVKQEVKTDEILDRVEFNEQNKERWFYLVNHTSKYCLA